jgi:DNA polymerase-4
MIRQIVHMDMDAFYVSCTLLKMPELAGKPLIIGGTSDRGVVTSASYEARKYGVRAAMPTRLALQRCPDAIVLKGDFELFSEYSDIINEIVTERAPLHERASIDEFYIDMTGMDRFFGSLKFTRELVQKVQKETGLPMSFGLSVNKTVAKMCTNFVKPQGNLWL